MLTWIKAKADIILIVIVTVGFMLFAYSCEPKVTSLLDKRERVTRAELQLELDMMLAQAETRMADFDRQERIRTLILQNALLLTQGQPFNPVGIITAIASIYGIKQAAQNTTGAIKNARAKRKPNNNTA